MTDKNSLSIAFVCWQAMPAIYPSSGKAIGGLELSAWLLAKSLANLREHSDLIHFFFRTDRTISERVVDNVELRPIKDCREWVRRDVSSAIANYRKHGFVKPDWRLIFQSAYLAGTWPFRRRNLVSGAVDSRLIRFVPDFWIAFGTSLESAAIMNTAKAQGKKGVLMIRSNSDLDEEILTFPGMRNAYGELGTDRMLAISNASLVICQTQLQQQLLADRFSVRGEVLPNAIELEPWVNAAARNKKEIASSHLATVLWVGRYDRFHKRPLLCIEIARRCPEIRFKMVINESDRDVQDEIINDRPENVSIVSYVPHDEMMNMMAEADLFLSTGASRYEGFPNVLLQAAATGIPIISLEDFDSFLDRSGAGVSCKGSLDLAVNSIKDFVTRRQAVTSSNHALAYLRSHHSHTSIAMRLRDFLVNSITSVSVGNL